MSWNYNCIDEFKRAFDAAQSNQLLRDNFQMGLMKGSIFLQKLGEFTFDIRDTMRQEYEIEQVCETIISTMPAMTACGADLPLVGEQSPFPPVYFSGFEKGVALDACRRKCNKDNLIDYLAKKEKSAGAGFGQLIDQVFLYGMPALGQAGITQLAGNHLVDLKDHPKFSDLCCMEPPNPNALANFFMYITAGMDSPVICMGQGAMELMGYRKMSSTGDTCGNLWDCVRDLLSSRGANITFDVDAKFDFVTGIDPDAPDDEKSVMWIYDRGYIKMGLESTETRNCSITKGHDFVESQRMMHMSGPQIHRYGASRWIYNFCDQQKIVDCVGDRHSMMCGNNPSFTVATPIVATP